MDITLFNRALQAAIDAAGAGARELLSALPSSDDELNIAAKEDGSLVSDADYASDHVISKILSPLEIPMLSEEKAKPQFEERRDWEYFWLIDPLDGTESFVSQRSGFAVNIALCDKSGPIIGIVADPLANRMYIGAKGRGFSVCQLDGSNERKIEAGPIQIPYRLVTSWVEKAKIEDLLPPGINENEVILRPVSGALKFCKLALGEAEIHARTGSYMEWDCAAGDAILRSIGIDVFDRKTHKRLEYNSEDLRINGLYTSRI